MSKHSLFDKRRKSGKLLELFIIAASAVITFLIHYSVLMAISCVKCCACTEQKDSVFPKLFTSSLATIYPSLYGFNHQKKEKIRGGYLAPQTKMLSRACSQGRAAARHSKLSLASPDWFQVQQLICSGQNRHDCFERGKRLVCSFFLTTDYMRDECVLLRIWLQSFRDFILTREWIMSIWYLDT